MPIERLFANNAAWRARKTDADPAFFQRLVNQQSPEFLWIGCSDSRVPANDIVGLDPGELFVHRNVANMVVPSDLNLLAVLQYAVEILKVRHVAVTGHYGCGGVRAAMSGRAFGLIDNWLRPIKTIMAQNADALSDLDEATRLDTLCELNVIEQSRNVAATTIVQDAWARGQFLQVHGWIYSLDNGRLHDLNCTLAGPEDLDMVMRLRRETPGA
ncbi:carbonate dehydratase [Roseospira marina]|uniref:Carbonic anhydrase 2 n=1 Tax=Roseospira marina TaxID=140057 RepID=A0A5M6I9R4_9PROT|nr:carbonate dehydratase [Roseospira marina]KAA5604902.1 carbonate dehydratase [Roseospira marina]MBB4315241.1 carbonic anhydrase [Roseospira marina]MBB5088241.1 carbonic anhydrase [Roseospira marina]